MNVKPCEFKTVFSGLNFQGLSGTSSFFEKNPDDWQPSLLSSCAVVYGACMLLPGRTPFSEQYVYFTSNVVSVVYRTKTDANGWLALCLPPDRYTVSSCELGRGLRSDLPCFEIEVPPHRGDYAINSLITNGGKESLPGCELFIEPTRHMAVPPTGSEPVVKRKFKLKEIGDLIHGKLDSI